MCDFANFLRSKLVGSHGQDLVSKEIVRTFKRSNVSAVELVMLLWGMENLLSLEGVRRIWGLGAGSSHPLFLEEVL